MVICVCDPDPFLSTPSARRATQAAVAQAVEEYISIHALREEGDLIAKFCCPQSCISIHALREEGDKSPLPRPPAPF